MAQAVKSQSDLSSKVEVTAQEKTVAAPGTVKLRSKNVDTYPLVVSVVGSDDIVFDSADTTKAVAPKVAEQVKYLPNVEVAE